MAKVINEEPEEPEEPNDHESLPDGGPSVDDVRKILGEWMGGGSVEKSIERNARDAMHQDEIGDDYWLTMHAKFSPVRPKIPRNINLNQFFPNQNRKIDPSE